MTTPTIKIPTAVSTLRLDRNNDDDTNNNVSTTQKYSKVGVKVKVMFNYIAIKNIISFQHSINTNCKNNHNNIIDCLNNSNN